MITTLDKNLRSFTALMHREPGINRTFLGGLAPGVTQGDVDAAAIAAPVRLSPDDAEQATLNGCDRWADNDAADFAVDLHNLHVNRMTESQVRAFLLKAQGQLERRIDAARARMERERAGA